MSSRPLSIALVILGLAALVVWYLNIGSAQLQQAAQPLGPAPYDGPVARVESPAEGPAFASPPTVAPEAEASPTAPAPTTGTPDANPQSTTPVGTPLTPENPSPPLETTPSESSPPIAPSEAPPSAPEPEPTPTPIPAAPSVDLAPIREAYAAEVRARIEANKRYPASARRLGKSGQVTLAFVIHADGAISDLKVETSSGTASLDDAAMAAVRGVAPFNPLPGELGETLTIIVPLGFSLR